MCVNCEQIKTTALPYTWTYLGKKDNFSGLVQRIPTVISNLRFFKMGYTRQTAIIFMSITRMSTIVNTQQLKGDVYGGTIAAIVALPLALGFGLQSGLGPAAGLYSAIVLGLIASLFGGTRSQISGPTGPMTVISALVVMTAIQHYGSVESGLGIIITTFFLAGCLQILLGCLGIGNYINYIPMPVISGFMTGIGIIIIAFQIPHFLGTPEASSVLAVFTSVVDSLQQTNVATLALGLGTFAVIWLAKPWNRFIPSPMLALLLGTAVSQFLAIEIPTVGDIPEGFHLTDLSKMFHVEATQITFVLISAITLAGLGALDSLLTSVIVDRVTRTRHNSNKELVGQGLGNSLAALFGGIPGAGATMRTMINIQSGGTTRLSGVVHSLLLIAILLGLGQYLAAIPIVVLAAILLDVGIKIVDKKSLKLIFRLPRTDVIIMISVIFFTVFANLLQAVAAGMILSALFLMKSLYETSIERTKIISLRDKLVDLNMISQGKDYQNIPNGIYIKEIYGPLFWGLTENFCQLISEKNIKEIILNMGDLHRIDQTGLYSLEDAILILKSKGVDVYIVCLNPQPKILMEKTKVIPDAISAAHLFSSYQDLVASRFNMNAAN